MRQLNLMQSMAALFATGLFMTAAPALATPANFDPFYGFESAGLEGLPSFNFDSTTSFLGAGEAGGSPVDVELRGSTDVCILFGDSTCRADTAGITGAYSVIVSIEVSGINTELIGGEDFTLFLSGVTGAYAPGEVQIELNPVVLAGLDTSAVPGFEFDDSFDTYSHLVYSSAYDYIGWNTSLGDRISFQYNVLTAPGTRGTPQLMANATAVVPEPGAALLMGLGLAGLASVNRGSKRRRITID
ncbi:MAG: PEP-CTERM sorting domain-containing protein [Myxococcota bacterium]